MWSLHPAKVLYLVFQLKTHTHLFEADAHGPRLSDEVLLRTEFAPLVGVVDGSTSVSINSSRHGSSSSEHHHAASGEHRAVTADAKDEAAAVVAAAVEEEEEEKDLLGLRGSLIWLALITVGVSLVSSVMCIFHRFSCTSCYSCS